MIIQQQNRGREAQVCWLGSSYAPRTTCDQSHLLCTDLSSQKFFQPCISLCRIELSLIFSQSFMIPPEYVNFPCLDVRIRVKAFLGGDIL